MARETKAQRLAREAAEQAAAMQQVAKDWPTRFVTLIQEYTSLPGFSLSATKEKTPGALRFRTVDTAVGYDTDATVNVVFNGTWEEIYEMEAAEQPISAYYAAKAEKERIRQAKIAAASKLSPEDLKLLNINPALF